MIFRKSHYEQDNNWNLYFLLDTGMIQILSMYLSICIRIKYEIGWMDVNQSEGDLPGVHLLKDILLFYTSIQLSINHMLNIMF